MRFIATRDLLIGILLFGVQLLASAASTTATLMLVPVPDRPALALAVVRLDIPEDWYVYGRSGGPFGQEPLSITISEIKGGNIVGAWKWAEAESIYLGKEISVYRGNPQFSQLIGLIPNENLFIRVEIVFQACSKDLCDAVRTIILPARMAINIKAE